MRLRTRFLILFDRYILRTVREFNRRTSTQPALPMAHLNHLTARDTAEFMLGHLHTALLYLHRFELMDFALKQLPRDGLILEFGVFQGESLDYLACKAAPRRIYGFDSFEGLRESWPGTDKPAAAFDLKGRLPKVPPNAELVPGWFDQSLPAFLEKHPGPIALLHIDSDTYEACRTIFQILRDRITPETVILFDEHHGYPGWRHGEFKALNEFVAANDRTCTYLGFSEAGAVVKIR